MVLGVTFCLVECDKVDKEISELRIVGFGVLKKRLCWVDLVGDYQWNPSESIGFKDFRERVCIAEPIQVVKGEFHTVQILYEGLEKMSIDIITRTRNRTENKFYSKKLLSLSSFVPAAPCVVSFITNSYLSLNSNIQCVLNTE